MQQIPQTQVLMELKPCRVVWVGARKGEKRHGKIRYPVASALSLFRSRRNPACSVCCLFSPQALPLLTLPWLRWIQIPPGFFLVWFGFTQEGLPSSQITSQGLQIVSNLPLTFQIHSGLPPQFPQAARSLCPEPRCLDPS